jgi:hypothetical protein
VHQLRPWPSPADVEKLLDMRTSADDIAKELKRLCLAVIRSELSVDLSFLRLLWPWFDLA